MASAFRQPKPHHVLITSRHKSSAKLRRNIKSVQQTPLKAVQRSVDFQRGHKYEHKALPVDPIAAVALECDNVDPMEVFEHSVTRSGITVAMTELCLKKMYLFYDGLSSENRRQTILGA